MGTRGRLKLPAHLSVVPPQATSEKTAADVITPAAPSRPGSLPAQLHGMWDELVAELDRIGLLARVDGPALELALRHYAAAVAASDELAAAESVAMHDEKNGRAMKHPAHQVFRDHSASFLAFAKELGLTFVARARTSVPKESDGDDANPFNRQASTG